MRGAQKKVIARVRRGLGVLKAVDVAKASDQLNRLIEKRADERDATNFEEMTWKESVRKHNARLWRERQDEWYCYFAALADSLRLRRAFRGEGGGPAGRRRHER